MIITYFQSLQAFLHLFHFISQHLGQAFTPHFASAEPLISVQER